MAGERESQVHELILTKVIVLCTRSTGIWFGCSPWYTLLACVRPFRSNTVGDVPRQQGRAPTTLVGLSRLRDRGGEPTRSQALEVHPTIAKP